MATSSAHSQVQFSSVNYGRNWLLVFTVIGLLGGTILELVSLARRPQFVTDDADRQALSTASDAQALQAVGFAFLIIGAVALLLLAAVSAIRFDIERSSERALLLRDERPTELGGIPTDGDIADEPGLSDADRE